MDNFRQDVRYALRALLQRPGFTLAALPTIPLRTARRWSGREPATLPRLADRNGLILPSISLRARRRCVTFTVIRRSREIGVRKALGARIQQVVRLVGWQGMSPGLIGLALGITGAIAGRSVIAGLLYEVKPHDPMTFAGVTLLLLAVVEVACIMPASRVGKKFHPHRHCALNRRRRRSLGGSP
jgi:hypothetical protein